MESPARLSISTRIWLLLGIFALCLLTSILLALNYTGQQLRRGAEHAATVAVEGTVGILGHYRALEEKGQLSRDDAQAQAVAAVEALRFDNGNYVFLHRNNGVAVSIVTSPQLAGKDLNDLQDPNGVYIVREIRAAAQAGGGFARYRWPTPSDKNTLIDKMTYSLEFKPWGWIVGSGVNLGRLEDDLAGVRQQFLLIALGSLAVIVLVGLLLIRSITRPLGSTIAAMADLSSGDGDLTRTLPETGPAELVLLARHFNQFSATIRELVVQVTSAGGQLTQAANSLQGVTRTTALAVQGQQAGTTQLSASMGQMLVAVQEVAGHAEQAAGTAEVATERTESSRQEVIRAMGDIELLAGTLTETSTSISRLSEESRNIDQVLTVIQSISEQTNLLALNAAIEAARAGEAGRGFAVVADEVRNLAQRTHDSTREIQTIIDNLQRDTQIAVQSMQAGVERAQASAEVSSAIEQSLNDIAASIQTVSTLTIQIAGATQEQAATAEEVNRSVIEISDQSASVSDEAGRTSAASGEITEIAERLSGLIRRFRV